MVGLIAGIGMLPVEFLRAADLRGEKVLCIAVVPGTEPALRTSADVYREISAFKLNAIIRTLAEHDVKEVTFLGKVTKEWLFKKHVLPDWRTVKLLNRLRKQNFKDDTVTLEIVKELESEGIRVLDQTRYLRPLMPGPQVFTEKKPTEEEMEDIRFGFHTAKAIGSIDLGQTVVVKHQAVMAVEAIEGTDACIKRGGALARGGAVVVKTAKPRQDSRFDVPAVGSTTLQSMTEGDCKVLAIEAHRTLFAEQDAVVAEANRRGMVVLAVEPTWE